MEEDTMCTDMHLADWEKHGGFMIYIIASLLVFYFMEVLCDEYFVPALTLLCKTLRLSDNVAGATFMAAGASSPELFVALCGVLKNSPVGTGTVVGSELFNMLIIVGFSAICSSTAMKLDWRYLVRELFFYGLSLGLLIYVLNDHEVHLLDAIMLVSAYGVYVFVCVFYSTWVNRCCPIARMADERFAQACAIWEPSATHTDAPSMRAGSAIGAHDNGNGNGDDGDGDIMDFGTHHGDHGDDDGSPDEAVVISAEERHPRELLQDDYFPSPYTTMMTLLNARHENIMANFEVARPESRADDLSESLMPVDAIGGEGGCAGYLFKQSSFYKHMRINGQMWQRRYFWIEGAGGDMRASASMPHSPSSSSTVGGRKRLCYCRNPANPEDGKTVINLRRVTEINTKGDLHFGLVCSNRVYNLRAKSCKDRDQWLAALTENLNGLYSPSGVRIEDDDDDDDDETFTLLQYPYRSSLFKRLVWLICYPFFFLMFLTIPDVRKGGYWSKLYPLTLFSVVAWLAGLSFGMVNATDRVGCILGIPSDVMGLTVGSIGTSLPNLFASMLVARQGLANMAVSNAFGSNVFNIFIALGVPWLVQTAFIAPGEAYPVPSSSINSTILVLAGFLMLFIVIMIMVKAEIGKRVGWSLVVLYVVFILYMVLASTGILPQFPDTRF